jgi:hypothetical protein
MPKTMFIAHRINTIEELRSTPREYGVEIDLRESGNNIILQHDAFKGGILLDEYLENYSHGLMILNIKSERIEHKALELLRKHGIKDYFFLDSSFPMIHLLSSEGEKNLAIRFSEFEGLDTVMAMKGKASWVWVDCFTKLPINKEIYRKLKDSGFKLCLVSPELENRDMDIENYRDTLAKENIVFDAICTKLRNIPRWQK